MNVFVRQEIKKYRRSLTRAQRAATYRRRPKRMKYPFALERRIYAKVRDIFAGYTERLFTFITSKYPKRILSDDSRQDDFATEFELFLQDLEEEYQSDTIKTGLSLDFTKYMAKISEFMLTFNQKEVADYMKSILGTPLYGTTEWWQEVSNEWLQNAVDRVAGSITDFYDKARALVLESIRNNVPYDEMVANLKALDTNLTDAKANFIAKDLSGKLNGSIERKLQLSLGITTYFWQTQADERVRGRPGGRYPNSIPSHWAMDSITCDWNNPHVCSFDYGKTWVPRLTNMPHSHPGDAWQCRCLGTPFSLDIMREIDKELAREEDLE
jgi:hypothetical protein